VGPGRINRPQIRPGLQQMRREGVSQGMTRHVLLDPRRRTPTSLRGFWLCDLNKRLAEHNLGTVTSTKAFSPWQIEVAIAFRDRSKAAAFEQYLKSHSGRIFAKRHF
jgi:hypothetical protein